MFFNFTTLALLPGATYTFLFYDFFFTPMICFGPGYQWKTFFIDGEKEKSHNLTTKLHIRATIGYNADNFFSNISFLVDNTNIIHDEGNLQIAPRSISLSFSIGYKF